MQVNEQFIVEAMVKHRAALTSEPRGKGPNKSKMTSFYRDFFSRFRPEEPKLHEATSSASFEAVRGDGGARGWLQGNPDITQEEMITMVETRPGVVESVKGPALQAGFEELVDRALKEPTSVKVSAILEPLKVRLITKGNTLRYWLSRDYQKQLWRYLQTFPQFVLTGRPLMASDLHDLIEREKRLGVYQFTDWVSGDYAAATDSLDLRHTKAAFEQSLRMGLFTLSPKYQDVLRSVLYEQDIYYPEKLSNSHEGLGPAKQTTGQLMGSTLSFPILCAVNLCAYWAALEERLGIEIEPRDLPVLVNGDDILFRCDQRLYRIWLRKVEEVGFELSLGKNYVHKEYLTVNSQLFHHKKSVDLNGRKCDTFKQCGVLNAGLLTGQSKITGRQGAKLAPLWDYFNEVTRGAINPERAKMRFIHYHRKTIEEVTQRGKYNLFITPMKGGLGFDPIGDLRATAFQRRFASFMDDKLRNDPEHFSKIAIITNAVKRNVPSIRHNPKFIVQPKYGPYEQGVVKVQDTTIKLPPLAARPDFETLNDFTSEMRIRHPKKKTLEEFRSRNWRQQNGSIYKDRYRLMEYVGQRPMGPHGFTDLSMKPTDGEAMLDDHIYVADHDSSKEEAMPDDHIYMADPDNLV
jgi:hypothetical protein